MDGSRHSHTKWSKPERERQIPYGVTYLWNLKKRHKELCRTDIYSQTLKNLLFPKETGWGLEDALRVWNGNAVKFGCDDCCTPLNVIKFIK